HAGAGDVTQRDVTQSYGRQPRADKIIASQTDSFAIARGTGLHPPDSPRPFAPFALAFSVIFRCPSALAFDFFPVPRQIFAERWQTDLLSSCIDIRRVFEFTGEFGFLIPGQNRPVKLRLAL